MRITIPIYNLAELESMPTIGRSQDSDLKLEETNEGSGIGIRIWVVNRAEDYGIEPIQYETLIDGRWRRCNEGGVVIEH